MGYERSDRWRDQGQRWQGYGRDEDDRGQRGERWRRDERMGRSGRDYDRPPSGYDYEDRGFFDRAGDEVRSWFGDEEAERRRRMDERSGERDEERWGGRDRERDWRGEGYGGSSGYGGSFGGYTSTGYGRSSAGGDYGAGRGAGATSMWGLGAGRDRDQWGYDPYRAWRRRQMEEFDRDYDEYRREHQSRFDQEFGSWRTNRQTQRQSLDRVREHQEVVGADGEKIGTVDKVRGDRIILTKGDAEAGGHHHSIPCSWIKNVADKVELDKSAEEARRVWRDEEGKSAFWSDQDPDREDSEGPHMLNRSFSGTY